VLTYDWTKNGEQVIHVSRWATSFGNILFPILLAASGSLWINADRTLQARCEASVS